MNKLDYDEKHIKIFMKHENTDNIFLLNDQKCSLNSSSLSNILHPSKFNRTTLEKIINININEIKPIVDNLINTNHLLHENLMVFDFDPYCNHLLSKDPTPKEIKSILTNINKNNNNNNNKNDYSKIVNPYGLEKVVFTGGGTKGIIYIGTMIGLYLTGQIFYLNHFSGTSIGALTAMILGCITPKTNIYDKIKSLSLNDIIINHSKVIESYKSAIGFMTERFSKRVIDTFYPPPEYTWYGIWTAIDTIIKNNGLYDPKKSGFQIWYGLICKKLCQIMENGLDELIIIKKKDGTILDKDSKIDYDVDTYEGWEIVRFFTFDEYHEYTNKTIVLTGTKTKRIETVYYTHTDKIYKSLSVMTASMASMSIPWVFKAPMINDSYNLDGGIFDNYPITHCDIKVKGRTQYYDNKIFGYLIDDKNSQIDSYELLRELWIIYDGFLEIMNIGYLKDDKNYPIISELFFEIRQIVFKLLYHVDNEIYTFMNNESDRIIGLSLRDLEEVLDKLKELTNHSDYMNFELPKLDHNFVKDILNKLLSFSSPINEKNDEKKEEKKFYKIGKKTNLGDIIDMSFKQGMAYNKIINIIKKDLEIIESLELKIKHVTRYEELLKYIMRHILAYYEIKGTLVKSNDLTCPNIYFTEIIKDLSQKMIKFETMTNDAVTLINKSKKKDEIHIKNYINNIIQISKSMISKILTRGSGNNPDLQDADLEKEKSSYQKALGYFFQTDMTGILYKFLCMTNDRICNDPFNIIRTINLNTFETSTLHFSMDNELKARLIYEGLSKTIKYFSHILQLMEITGINRPNDNYIESIELRYYKYINSV